MSSVRDAWAQSVASALEAYAVAVVQMAPGHWAFGPADAPGLRATASLTDDWLLFDAPLPEPLAGATAWDAFVVNALLPSGLKVCTGGSDPVWHLRAELPLLEQRSIARAVPDVCTGLAAAAGLRAEALGVHPAAPPTTTGEAAAAVRRDRVVVRAAWIRHGHDRARCAGRFSASSR
jgi:hypothetical protein